MTNEEAIKQIRERICCEGAGGKVYHFCRDECMYGEDKCEVSVAIKALERCIRIDRAAEKMREAIKKKSNE